MSTRGARRTSDLRVTTAAEAAAFDHAAIAAGVSSFELMLRAGTAAAAVILRDYGHRLARGVAIHAGLGNNGGDAYIVAAQLARAGLVVRLYAAGAPRTDDAQQAAAIASPSLRHGPPNGSELLVVDGLLGTGHHGALREPLRASLDQLANARDRDAIIIALDLPSGLDATTGEIATGSVAASVTLSFGTLKRAQLTQRAHVGRIVLLDIGIGRAFAGDDVAPDDVRYGAWRIGATSRSGVHGSNASRDAQPARRWDAHKGTRGRVAIVGGARGMGGAISIAARAALATGAGLVKAIVDEASLSTVQHNVVQAIAEPWPNEEEAPSAAQHDAGSTRSTWAHAAAIGPGLGRTARSLDVLHQSIAQHASAPIVLDADALTIASDPHLHADDARDAAARIARWCERSSAVVLTPHPGEFARLLGYDVPEAWGERANVLRDFAMRARAIVLLKGAPTLVAGPDAPTISVIPRGNASLATGGSGDMLTGVIAALLAAGTDPLHAAELGATLHGVAAEKASARAIGSPPLVHGISLDAIIAELPLAFAECTRSLASHAGHDVGHHAVHDGARDVLYELPALT